MQSCLADWPNVRLRAFYYQLGVVASAGEAKGAPKLLRVSSPQQLFALLLTETLRKMGSLPQRALPVTLDLLEG